MSRKDDADLAPLRYKGVHLLDIVGSHGNGVEYGKEPGDNDRMVEQPQ